MLDDYQTKIRIMKIIAKIRRKLGEDDFVEFAYPYEDFCPYNAERYREIIKNPMSFEDIHIKINSDSPYSMEEFVEDVQLISSNCKTFNSDDEEYQELASKLENALEESKAEVENEAKIENKEFASQMIGGAMLQFPTKPNTGLRTYFSLLKTKPKKKKK